MTEQNHQTDSFVNSGTSPPGADNLQHKRSEYIAEGFKNRTYGERKFNMRTYIGLGYFGSLAASIGLTWALRDTRFARTYEGWGNTLAKWTQGAKEGVALAEHNARIGSNMTIFSMFAGTTLMAILPIKWREDHKAETIKRYDIEHYGAERVASDPQIQEAHALIEAAPKQTWLSVIGSRFVAFAATMGVAHFIGSNKSMLGKAKGISIDRWSIEQGRKLDSFLHRGNPETLQKIKAAIVKSPHDLSRPADSMTSRIASYLALDGLYTVMTGGVLYIFTRVLAPMFDTTLNERTNALPAHIQAEIGKTTYHGLTRHEKPSTAVPLAQPSLQVSSAQLEAGRISENSAERGAASAQIA